MFAGLKAKAARRPRSFPPGRGALALLAALLAIWLGLAQGTGFPTLSAAAQRAQRAAAPAAFQAARDRQGHTYPRVVMNQWGGAVPWYYARFDMAMTRINDPDFTAQVKALNPQILWLPTEDFNTTCEPGNPFWPQDCPEAWILHDSAGNRVHKTYGQVDTNLSRFSGVTTALPERIAEIVSRSGADGHATDGLWSTTHYAWSTWDDADMDNNGVNDLQEYGKSGTLANWGAGVEAILSGMRQRLGPGKIILVNTGSGDTPGRSVVNGYYFEYHSWPLVGGWLPNLRHWQSVWQDVQDPPIFLQQSNPDGRDPQKVTPTKNYLRFMRWSLVDALMLGAYYQFEHVDGKSPDHYWNNYFDEFDLELGYPTGPPQEVKAGVWARFFDYGVAVHNVSGADQTVSDAELRSLPGYAGPYFRFLGGQDLALNGARAMNNGQLFTSLTLRGYIYQGWQDSQYAAGDGVILLRQPQIVVSPIILDNAEAGTSPASQPPQLSGFAQESDCRAGELYYTVRCAWNPGTFAYALASPGDAQARFAPNIGVPGYYQVYEWHGRLKQGSMARNARYRIEHADGVAELTIDQNQNAGRWNSLGVFRFTAGQDNAVVISAQGADGPVMADAVMLVFVAAESQGSFVDVPSDHWAFDNIEWLYQQGYVAGCRSEPRMFCPEQVMSRAEAAVFVVRGVRGADFSPPQPTATTFQDVALSDWFADWVTQLWDDGYTAGCLADPLSFCPLQGHTRAEATVFFLRMLHGKDYTPPGGGELPYSDVPTQAWYYKWVVAAHQAGLVGDCEDPANRGDDRFHPLEGVTRAEAACMMTRAKGMATP